MRQLHDNRVRDHATERRISLLWTELGFALEDLGIGPLAKRCRITGKHWSDPEHYDEVFLQKADISLERMEQLAGDILQDINR